jgi:5-dehydro-2-deoxygluconokinase
MTLAKTSNTEVIFDIDYRPVLWGLGGHGAGEVRFVDSAAVTRHLQPLLGACDVIVGTEEEFHIAGGSTDTLQALGRVRELSQALLVLKRGAQGAVAFPSAIPERLEDGVSDRGFPVEVYNVLGAGDAFMAGFLRGHLTGASLADSLRMANGCGALVVSRHGCAPAMATWPELRHLMEAGSSHRALRHDPTLNHLHWSTTRRSDYPELTVLAFDHRVQLERMADRAGQSRDRIPKLKQLIYRAGRQEAGGERSFGIIVDDRYGQDVLDQASGLGHFIARPIELPETTPLHFEGQADVGVTLAEWPVDHVVKCLVKMHPGDPADLQAAQHRQLEILFNACRSTGHEFLLEVVPTRGAANDGAVLAATLSQLYGLGIRPDWWKLAGPDGSKGWQAIADAIGNGDPYCRGVVLLGLDAPEQEMAKTLGRAAEQPICKGFAIGRTIIGEAAADWLGGRIDDDTAVAHMAAIYRRLIEAWRDASSARRQSA